MLWISGDPNGHRKGELLAADGVPIPYREWYCPGAGGVFCYLHGQGDHSGPFTAMGDVLHQAGFSVYAHDHRGFGRSPAQRGHIDTYDQFISDTVQMIDLARARHPGRPIFLVGQSMGGHLALRTAVRARDRLAGVVAISPGFRLRWTPWREMAALGWRLLAAPNRPLPAVTRKVRTTRNQLHLERASQDEHWVRAFTPRFYLESLRSVRRAYWEMPAVRVSTLVLMAGEDQLVCARTARRYWARVGARDKEFRLLPDLYHNVVAEPEMPEVAALIIDWAKARLQAALA